MFWVYGQTLLSIVYRLIFSLTDSKMAYVHVFAGSQVGRHVSYLQITNMFLFKFTSLLRIFHSYRDEPIGRWGEKIVPQENHLTHPQAELGMSHMCPMQGSNPHRPQRWGDRTIKSVEISDLTHSVMGAVITDIAVGKAQLVDGSVVVACMPSRFVNQVRVYVHSKVFFRSLPC